MTIVCTKVTAGPKPGIANRSDAEALEAYSNRTILIKPYQTSHCPDIGLLPPPTVMPRHVERNLAIGVRLLEYDAALDIFLWPQHPRWPVQFMNREPS